jgi:hypothetical protein
MQMECILFANACGLLAESSHARELLHALEN